MHREVKGIRVKYFFTHQNWGEKEFIKIFITKMQCDGKHEKYQLKHHCIPLSKIESIHFVKYWKPLLIFVIILASKLLTQS